MSDRDLKLLIYDLDGTVLDSATTFVEHMISDAGELGLPIGEELSSRLTACRGMYGQTVLEHCWDLNCDEAAKYYEQFKELDKRRLCPLIPGVKNTIKIQRNVGYMTAILTGRHKSDVLHVLAGHDIEYLFDHVAGGDESQYKKPDPRAFDNTINYFRSQFGIGEKNCIYYGDTPIDIICANDRGIEAIGVETGGFTRQELLNAGAWPENILPSVAHAVDWLVERGY